MPTANPPGRTLWLMAAIVLVGLNLRLSMAAVGPLLNAMRGEIALSFGDVSLLTALPMLTLGLGMFFGLGIARRVGEWRSVALALLLIGAASALRLGSRGLPDLLGSAMLAGLGIALIQALMPALIKARFGARTPLCMGLYDRRIALLVAQSANPAGLKKLENRWEYLSQALRDLNSKSSALVSASGRPWAPIIVDRHARALSESLMRLSAE